MNIQEGALFLSIGANIAAIAYFAGRLKAQAEAHTKTLDEIKKTFNDALTKMQNDFKERLKELKENLSEKIGENAKHFEEYIGRLEEKQDKHNSVIERTFHLEKREDVHDEQIKVANHRIEDLENKINV